MAANDVSSDVATTNIDQADSIRNTMSLANVLSESTDSDIGITPSAIKSPATPRDSASLMAAAGTTTVTVCGSPVSEVSDLSDPPEGFENEADTPDNEAEDTPDNEAEDIPDSDRAFICMNDEFSRCQTGQYTLDLSRKVISDHFGRNKACTKDITSWPLFCRKHYQRATYNKDKWQKRKIELIMRQLDIIEEQHPGTTYNVQFKKSEESRLNRYARLVSLGSSSEEAAKGVLPMDGKVYEAPIDILRELDQYVGRRQPITKVKEAVEVISQMLNQGECEQVPSIEFLPQLPGRNLSRKVPAKGRELKSSKCSKTSKAPKIPKTPKATKTSRTPKNPKTLDISKTPTHVSSRGSVKKLSQKG